MLRRGPAVCGLHEGQKRQEVPEKHGVRQRPLGTREDIAPYVDPVFRNNVILTQTESLTMNSRPKDPRTARNKNVLIIGGSGSGKTRFWLKPNLMQMHSSYVVTDPKGTILVECGKMLSGALPSWVRTESRCGISAGRWSMSRTGSRC